MATNTNVYYKADLAATKQVIAARAADIYSIIGVNVASNAITYLQFFDALTADVTVGTTAPKFTVAINTAAASNITTSSLLFDTPLYFKTGVVIAATTTATGSTAPAGNVLVTVQYN